jgi:hypothetical protein
MISRDASNSKNASNRSDDSNSGNANNTRNASSSGRPRATVITSGTKKCQQSNSSDANKPQEGLQHDPRIRRNANYSNRLITSTGTPTEHSCQKQYRSQQLTSLRGNSRKNREKDNKKSKNSPFVVLTDFYQLIAIRHGHPMLLF